MKFSHSERETLIGPAVVGIVVGIFFAVCNVAFNSEYKPAVSSDWQIVSDAMLSFLAGLLLAFLPFGLIPVLMGRLRSGAGGKSR